jgi:2-succinyl-6-hydroxy-2,4-cyclohexadiene-1-carboxylate synthase
MPSGDFSDVIDAIAQRELHERVTLVGYSLGARLALSLAMRYPERVSRAVLIGVAPGFDDPQAREARLRSDEALAHTLLQHGVASFVETWEAQPLFASQRTLDRARIEAQRRWRNAHTAHGLAWSLRTLGLARQPSWRDAMRRHQVAIELVTGACDTKFTAIAQSLVAAGAARSHTVVPAVGHNVVFEAPEALAALVRGDGV